jgi:outer membrane protein
MNLNQLTFLSILWLISLFPAYTFAQDASSKNLTNASLQEVIDFALQNKPNVKQSFLDEEIAERDINSALSGWLPQISANASLNHNLKQQVNALTTDGNTSYITFGTKNTSSLTLQADQQFLNAGLIQASKSARYFRQQYRQNTENTQINTVVEVSKAFYDILTSQEQQKIIQENIARLEKQLKDAKAQFDVGLVDNTDYQRAQISLSNSKADRKRNEELLKYKYAYLKSLIGYQTDKELSLTFNNKAMEEEVLLDTAQVLDPKNRIELRLLETQKQLQTINTGYNKLAYLPKLSGFINYSRNYLNNDFSELYNRAFPSSVAGLSLNIPIFQGTKRIQEIRKSQLLERRIDLEIENAKNNINAQYERALATYKAGLNDWRTANDNVTISKQVYNTIKLQYDEGIKTYLDLMSAETDLRTSQLNYLNALYSLLSAKLDVQQALGTINITQ